MLLGLAACGGGTASTSTGGGSTTVQPTSVQLLVSSPTLASDGSSTVTLTALVKGTGNTAMSGQTVSFASDSGVVTVVSATTDASGAATATIGTGSDPTNRTIAVTATVGSVVATNSIAVSGTTITISGPSSLVSGNTATFDIFLKDSAGQGISGKTLAISSSAGNGLSSSSPTTDSNGRATIIVTGSVGGTDTISATGLGATGTQTLSVSTTNFTFTAPASAAELNISTAQTVTVHYDIAGTAQSGVTVHFSTTRGTVSAASAVTNGSGNASITVSSTTAGPAVLTASVTSGPSVQRSVEFVATTPNSITIQASPAVIGTQEQSTITAVVRDSANNLVKNQTVVFNIVADTSNGNLSTGTAVTGSNGSASTVFTAGTSTTAQNGVTLRATVQGTGVTQTTTLTVSAKALFITLGTGNTVVELNSTTYQLPYNILVTDASGNAVSGAVVTFALRPTIYRKGTMHFTTFWTPNSPYVCTNEDLNNNGIFDSTDNDTNGNGTLEPGIVAAVDSSVTTTSSGTGSINLTYAQDHAYWTDVVLTARATVAGSESTTSVTITLPGISSDYGDQAVAPPGFTSPYGVNICATPN